MMDDTSYRATPSRSLPIVYADQIGEAVDLDDFVEGLPRAGLRHAEGWQDILDAGPRNARRDRPTMARTRG